MADLGNTTVYGDLKITGDLVFNGSSGGFASADHSHKSISYLDTRSVDSKPFDYVGISMHLKTNTTDGLSDGGTYHAVQHITSWGDASGGAAHQLAFTASGNIWSRFGTSSWSAWRNLYHSGNIGSWNMTTTAPTATTRLNYNGYLYATRVYNAVYNDYAEYFLKGESNIEAGDIVKIDPNTDKYIKSTKEYDKLVVGIVSDDYGQCLGGKGDGNDDKDYSPVGVAGRVRVKVTGKVRKGDLIVASAIPGVGMASNIYTPGTVVAKALADHDGESIDRILALIMNV